MPPDPAQQNGRLYCNPVFRGSFPDPFVMRWAGRFYAYATGRTPDGRIFPTLTSTDLVDWTVGEGAMEPLREDHQHYWAPEVVYRNGRFYLYYSVGNETLMELRVAVSARPDGGFIDAGYRISTEDFAIDAHVFRDEDGSDHLFYATDYLEHTHIGTGSAKARLASPWEIAGPSHPVTRAKYDWQVYHPNRPEKGFVRWHTVEGPAVLKRKSRYYQMFSGGNWQNDSYGVSYAVTSDIDSPEEWEQVSDGVDTFPILRTIEGRIIGPGHNSVVYGPNGRELFCVYHEWIDGERVPAIDRLDFAGDRLFLIGPTDTPQPAPFEPQIIPPQEVGPGEPFRLAIPAESLIEIHFARNGDGAVELAFGHDLKLTIDDAGGELAARWICGTKAGGKRGLADFRLADIHYIRIDLMHRRLSIAIDGMHLLTEYVGDTLQEFTLTSSQGSLSFPSISFTPGFEELFTDERLADRGWSAANVSVRDGAAELAADMAEASLSRHSGSDDHEVCFNIARPIDRDSRLIVEAGSAIEFTAEDHGWMLRTGGETAHLDMTADEWRQVRIRCSSGQFDLSSEGFALFSGECRDSDQITWKVSRGKVSLEMIRYTDLSRGR